MSKDHTDDFHDGRSPSSLAVRDETQTSLAALLRDVARTVDPERNSGTEPRATHPGVGPYVGRFEVMRLLGRGGFGVVCEARDSELGRHVALKLMRTDDLRATDRAVLVDMFRREAGAAAKLTHPNVVTIHDHGSNAGVPYLVLELLDGETLASRLKRGPFSCAEAVAIMTQICRGLVHAHGAGVIHRDIKPSNVFLRSDGQVKILDFGLARVENALTFGRTGGTVSGGTPAYMAPEQWRGESQDERTDVFACGVVLFEMLTARLPFALSQGGRSDVEGGARVGPPMAGLPSEVVPVLERALAHDPGDRFQSAQDILTALLGVGQIAAPAPSAVENAKLREVTMLFADIRGFTKVSATERPEQIVATLNSYFDLMVKVLIEHQGTLDKIIGDELVGLFGTPIDVEDAAGKAIACALAMQAALLRFNASRAAAQQVPIHVGIGIHTGTVVTGAIGSSSALRHTAIGDAMNIGSRLQRLAKADDILISVQTRAALGDRVQTIELSPMEIDGTDLRVYRLLGFQG